MKHQAPSVRTTSVLNADKIAMEQAEVLLTNLLALANRDDERFLIPFFDLVVSLEVIRDLLASKEFYKATN